MTETIQKMPHRRGTRDNPSLKTRIPCLNRLLLCAARTPEVLTNLVGLLMSTTFSSHIHSRRRTRRWYLIDECANYARKSCITCHNASTDIILSEIHGYDQPSGVENYTYKIKTGKSNCRNHLLNKHGDIYDKTVQEKNWRYRLSADRHGAKRIVDERRDRTLPPFSSESFIDYLVRFIVADDQVSNVFRTLTHVLTSS